MQIRGMLIRPVSDISGNTPSMSWFNWGVKVIVMVVDRPADILPEGVYWIKKKSYKVTLVKCYLDAVVEGEELEGVKGEGDVGHQNGLSVG